MAEEVVRPSSDELRIRALAIFYGLGGFALVLFILYLFVVLWPVTVLVLISLFFVAALTPLVRWIQKRFNRKTATTIVVTLLLVGILGLVVLTIPALANQLTTVSSEFDKLFRQFQADLSQSSPELAKILGQIKVATLPTNPEPQAAKEVIFSAFTLITGFVTVVMLTAYLVVEGPAVASALMSLLPRKHRLQARQMFGEIGEQAGAYIRGQLITSMFAALVTFGILTAFGVPNALALAWVMALATAIPIVGAILGTIPAVISAYAVGQQTALYVLVSMLVYQQIENYVIIPHVYGRALKLSPLAVLLAILVGSSLLGILGAFLALPFAAVIPILLRHFNEWRAKSDPAEEGPPAEAAAEGSPQST